MITRILLTLTIFSMLLPAPCLYAQKLRLGKNDFTPGESITVTFSAPSAYPGNAWVGIIPASVRHGSEAENDKHDLSYQYLKQRTSGTLVFTAPRTEGAYDIRMHDTDSDGKEVASVSFTVSAALSQPALTLSRKSCKPGESITVQFKAPKSFPSNAWVGIVPSSIQHGSEAENDKHDLSYQYLKSRTSGTLRFTAPTTPGSYDFRMHDTDADGNEVASVTFVVK